MAKRGNFFVIMPFDKKSSISDISYKVIYDMFIEPTINELHFDCTKVDKMDSSKSSLIVKNILNPLCDPKNYVLADISDISPNVLYELGVRHALIRDGTFIITQDIKTVPFDIKDLQIGKTQSIEIIPFILPT